MTEENKNENIEKEAKDVTASEAKQSPEAKAETKAPEAKAEEKDVTASEAKQSPKPVVADGTPRKPSAKPEREPRQDKQDAKGGRGEGRKGAHGKRQKRGGGGGRFEEQSEFEEKVVQIRRVTKVVKGGKKLSFRAVVIIGNQKDKVGVGVGKASDVLGAIKKAVVDAKKHIVELRHVGTTVSHSVIGEAGGSKILLRPAADGTGIIAGGTARIVLELGGVGDILAKSQGSKSPLNVARATVQALQSLRSFEEVARDRDISVKQMLF